MYAHAHTYREHKSVHVSTVFKLLKKKRIYAWSFQFLSENFHHNDETKSEKQNFEKPGITNEAERIRVDTSAGPISNTSPSPLRPDPTTLHTETLPIDAGSFSGDFMIAVLRRCRSLRVLFTG